MKYKTKVTFALSLVGDRIPEVGNTYEQRRSYNVEVLTHRLVSNCVEQVGQSQVQLAGC